MPPITEHCYDCGSEFVAFTASDGTCPDCGSPATPLIGDATVFDVRPTATVDTRLAEEVDELEVVVRDDTERLVAYTFATPEDGQPFAVAVTFDDVTIRRGDEFWSEVEGPAIVASAVEERVGEPPGPPDATSA